MGRLTRIQQLVNGTIATGHVRLMPRGILYYADQLLRGTVRFSKRSGNDISMLNVDNTFLTTVAASSNNDFINLSGPSSWIQLGSLISIGPGLEFKEVQDISTNTLILTDPLTGSYPLGTPVVLHSVPLQMVLAASSGDDTVTVNSHFRLANGDVFAYLQAENLLQSITEVEITQATFNGTTGDPEFGLQYTLTLKAPLLRNIASNAPVYLRAYPAYFGTSVNIPNSVTSTDPLGPILIDYMSGKLLEGQNYRETFSIAALDRVGNPVIGSPNVMQTVPKNFPITDRSVHAHTPIFWDLGQGVMRITPNRVLLNMDPSGHFIVGVKCVPNLIPGTTWKILVQANETATIRFIFNPYPLQQFSIPSSVSTPLIVGIPSGSDPIESIEINATTASGLGQISLTDWAPTGAVVTNFNYAIVAQATGIATWQSSGLIIKPIFLSSDLLRAQYDSGVTNDSGKVFF